MKEKQEFTIRVRHYATGEIVACSHHEMAKEKVELDDVVLNYDIGDPDSEEDVAFREFDVVLTARPPEAGRQVTVTADVPDGADAVAVDVPDSLPAASAA